MGNPVMGGDGDNGRSDTERAPVPKRSVWKRALTVPEGKILIGGVVVLLLYATCIALMRLKSPALFHDLLAMTSAHILMGRAAGMTVGYASGSQFGPWVVILSNMAIETFLVLLFYPLFVFSYNRLIVIKPLEDAMARARRAAMARQGTIMKYGIPGLLLFVWFPFWMTGPLVGCVIGFLIGLRPWANVAVVLAGTYLAILCWGFALHHLHESLARLGYYVPLIFVGFILLLAVSIHIRYAFWKHAVPPEGDDGAPEER